jgi:hypothetical protein
VHQGDTDWVVEQDSTLGLRKVRLTWTGADEVTANGGLENGDRASITTLPTAIVGMQVEVVTSKSADPAPSSAPAGG